MSQTQTVQFRNNVKDKQHFRDNVEHTEKETEKKVQHALGGINRLNVGYNVSGCINQAY